MKEELDPFPFILAKELGITLQEVGEMPQADFIAWRAFITYERAMQAHAHDVAAMKAKGR